MTSVFDGRSCMLGEGPMWHPERHQLFWFDILGKRLLTRVGDEPQEWHFPDLVSAAGWIDRTRLLIASERALFAFDVESGRSETLALLEADNPATRSNDGRADPWGGFWIGTMGKAAEPGAGAIYRYFRGELRMLYPGISIPNAISFTPGGRFAYFADSARQTIWRQELTARDGWPQGEPTVFLDLAENDLAPDGAVVDAEGYLWVAQWGASRVARHAPDGRLVDSLQFAARHTSCPAFGGQGLSTLFVTSARQGLSPTEIAENPANGLTFAVQTSSVGQQEHQVIP